MCVVHKIKIIYIIYMSFFDLFCASFHRIAFQKDKCLVIPSAVCWCSQTSNDRTSVGVVACHVMPCDGANPKKGNRNV